ncbi:uncharacterized protein LOC100141683 isoform X2 [Tribolium castaneum]|uniref:Protein TsetseEP domain-containing protein n=1 Tax=Tribolium castaneum TaxID=7070 RepID=D6WXX3_TRICA|nr:PREDICTED: uncharacterized protein LOC100141683 isoform X2 [Tribolium castaneum]EFA07708.1 hypothetical protein TcasGA2_TC002185 [Tribolium castaneum]|eukprot:XP_001809239.1 PREDICTED: uncharacterized protein LOC100141683 isoform X2 [Tribolium castaneum]
MNNVFKQVKRSFAVLSALFITVVTSKIRGHQNCGPEHLVHCAKPLSVLTDSGLTFATNKPELDRMCPDLRDAVKCIHGYTRHCMSMEEREHFKTLFHGTVIMVEDLCRNETYQTEYLKYAPCMKKVEKQNEMCLKTYTKAMKEIESRTEEQVTDEPDLVTYQKRKRETADEGIRSVCCSFQRYVECSTHTMRRACGEDAADFSREFLDKISSSLIRMHCNEYGRRECGIISGGEGLSKISSLVLALLATVAYYVR